MSDLKYHELVKWLQDPENVKIERVDPSLDVPFWAFVANSKSVLSLAAFPAGAVHAEKLNQFIHDVVVYRKTGQLGASVDVDMTGQEMLHNAANTLVFRGIMRLFVSEDRCSIQLSYECLLALIKRD